MLEHSTGNLKIVHERQGPDGRFTIDLGDNFEANMTYAQTQPGVVSVTHTGVPPEFRGKNIAARLVDFGIHALVADGQKIIPTCSYVAAQFKRHKEWFEFLA